MFFQYTINSDTLNPIMFINKQIGKISDENIIDDYIDGSKFQEELLFLSNSEGIENVTIYINSPGGNVMDGMNIYNSIIESKIPIITINAGICASIASVIFLAGKTRKMYDYSNIMIHNPFSTDDKDDKDDKTLEIFRKSIVTMISNRCDLNEDEISDLMNTTSWIDANESLKYKLCDEVLSNTLNEINVITNGLNTDLIYKHEKLNLILNKILNKNRNKNMKNIINILNKAGLTIKDDDSDETIYNVVKALVDKKNDMDDNEEECDCDEKYNDLLNKFNDLKTSVDEIKSTFVKSEDDKSIKIEDILNTSKINGKIKEEEFDLYRKLAKNDFNLFKDFVNTLPVNKIAVKIETTDDKVSDERLKGYQADHATTEMNRIKNKLK